MQTIEMWRHRARQLRTETYALYLAYRDPRMPWYARLFAALVMGYAFSPIDLIPDFIPVLGYLDDLVIVPLGVLLALKMIPPTVWAESREQARQAIDAGQPVTRAAAVVIVAIWLLAVALAVYLAVKIAIAWRAAR